MTWVEILLLALILGIGSAAEISFGSSSFASSSFAIALIYSGVAAGMIGLLIWVIVWKIVADWRERRRQ